jgi:hypothetical protein
MLQVGMELLSGFEISEPSIVSYGFTFCFVWDMRILNYFPITLNSRSKMSDFMFLVPHR